MTLTAERLREVLHYCPDTGEFTWQKPTGPRVKPGDIAGEFDGKGYRRITIEGQRYPAHRLAWLYMTGEWAKETVDHKNCDGLDNRWENLREANICQQAANQRIRKNHHVGLKGVHKTPAGRFVASIWRDGRLDYLGTFDTAEEAHAVYLCEAIKLHGEFARAA